ncbi:MAG: hypothetical protein HC906_00815 [Bacteroidales bacterium]|nr:hypothetical protein [Bacteroidales bacterium]
MVVTGNLLLTENKIPFNAEYTFNDNGKVKINYSVLKDTSLPVLPRIGLIFYLKNDFNDVEWYGLGPHETYSDRKKGAKTQIFSGSVQEQHVPYINPQENGNKKQCSLGKNYE